jgi:hypothetical protein
MAHRIQIRSRSGNVALGVIGAIYLVCGIGTLLFYLVTSWGAAALIDRFLQLTLAGSALAGAFFLVTAAGNLGLDLRSRRRHS